MFLQLGKWAPAQRRETASIKRQEKKKQTSDRSNNWFEICTAIPERIGAEATACPWEPVREW